MTFSNFEICKLANFPHHYHQTVALIEESFDYRPEHQFEVDFAPLINKDNLQNSYLLREVSSQKLIGHIGVVRRNLKNHGLCVPVALIGGIAIEKTYRGRGLFHHFFQEILSQVNSQVALFILWGEHAQLYKKYGFHLGVGQVETAPAQDDFLQTLKNHHFQKVKFCQLNRQDQKSIIQLYEEFLQNAFLTFQRENRHWEHIKKITSSDLYIQRNKNLEIEAYLFMNKGQDLPGIVHEVAFKKSRRTEMIDLLGRGKVWLPEILKTEIASPFNITSMGLFRPGEPQLLTKFLADWSQNKIQIQAVDGDGQGISFLHNKKAVRLPFEKFLQSLFGPHPAEEFQCLGAPIFMSGLDSI